MIEHCEFPYGDEGFGWHLGGPGFLTLAVIFLLGVVVGAILVNIAGRPVWRRSEASVDEVWRTVHRAIAKADGMPDDRILAGLNQLIATVEQTLGGVMKVGAETQLRLRGLRDAAEGKPPAPPPGEHHPKGHGADAAHHKADPRTSIPVRIDQSVGSPRVEVTIIEAPGPGAHGDGHGHDPARPRDLRQMLADARVAIGVFSNYWSDETARVADLRAAREDLLRRQPRAG